ncbi:MAG: DNA starvation/stationary phase protection protein Dps [Rhizobiaceae bacterium]
MDITTRNDLKSNAKKTAIDLLNARLADAIDLLTKQAHWNVKGPTFIGLHKMLDDHYEEIEKHVDVIAERAVQLGGMAQGTLQQVSKASPFKAYPTDITKTKDHLAALIERYAMAAKRAREAVDDADEAGDMDTTDLFIDYSRALDKMLWFLEAHVQESE